VSAHEPIGFLAFLRVEARLYRRDDPLLGDFARDVLAYERELGPPSRRPKRRHLPPWPTNPKTKDETLAFYQANPSAAEVDEFWAEYSKASGEYRAREREWVAAGFPPNPNTFDEVAEYLERAGLARGFPDVDSVAYGAWLQYQVTR
jgi:hypothetical protein